MKETPKPADEAKPPKPQPRIHADGGALAFARRHLRFGWWSLLVYLTLGVILESLHGFKVGWYLDVSSSTRRLMWTLAHAHGTLLGMMHVAFGATLPLLTEWHARARGLASKCFLAASILLPAGFFLGGITVYAGDPGLGILLVPVGALLLFVAVLLTARGAASVGVERKQLMQDGGKKG